MKRVPATDTRIKINGAGDGIDDGGVKWVINPYDEFALEAALQIKDADSSVEVVIFSIGGKEIEKTVRECLGRGADRAVRMDDPEFEGSDSLGQARLYAAAIQAEGMDLVLTGKQTIDMDDTQVPAELAEFLGWPQAYAVDHLEYNGGNVVVHRDAGGGAKHVLNVALPAVISCDKGLNTPRFASLKEIMRSKRKKIAKMKAKNLELSGGVGAGGAVVRVDSWSLPPERPAGQIIDQGSPEANVAELVRLLREEAKVL